MHAFDLVIFDCDGVLVDSEAVSNEVLAGYAVAVSPLDARASFAELSVDDVRLSSNERFGVMMPDGW